jgi:hypothetical protein
MRRDFLTEIGFICAIFLLGCGWVAVQISAYRSQHTATSTCRVLDIQMSQIESSNSSHPPLSRISIFTDQPPITKSRAPKRVNPCACPPTGRDNSGTDPTPRPVGHSPTCPKLLGTPHNRRPPHCRNAVDPTNRSDHRQPYPHPRSTWDSSRPVPHAPEKNRISHTPAHRFGCHKFSHNPLHP